MLGKALKLLYGPGEKSSSVTYRNAPDLKLILDFLYEDAKNLFNLIHKILESNAFKNMLNSIYLVENISCKCPLGVVYELLQFMDELCHKELKVDVTQALASQATAISIE